jgi:hypothetical protein
MVPLSKIRAWIEDVESEERRRMFGTKIEEKDSLIEICS